MTRLPRLLLPALLVVGATVMVPLSASAGPGSATPSQSAVIRADYPTWDEVNAAKQDQAAKQAEVDTITGLLTSLEDEAAQLGDEAVKRGNEYLKATSALQAATQVADEATARANDAEAKAAAAKEQFGQLTAQLYRSGGNQNVALLLSGDDATSLLYQLGTMSKLTEQSAQLNDLAVASQNLSETLQAQATTAQDARTQLAAEAEQAAEDAQAAQEAADAQVADQQAKSDVLYAQLATLQDSTAALEQSYRDGVAAAKAEAERQAAAQQAAQNAANTGSGSNSGDASSATLPPGSVTVDPSGAKAYAASQVAARGWGSEQYSCLVSLWNRESGWRVNAYNESSGAYGIPQSLPGSKMASSGSDWRTNAQTQVNWGLTYISGRYGNPCGAWAHSENTNPHWY